MKKLMALILAGAMALSMVACGSSEPAPAPAPKPVVETPVAAEKKVEIFFS